MKLPGVIVISDGELSFSEGPLFRKLPISRILEFEEGAPPAKVSDVRNRYPST